MGNLAKSFDARFLIRRPRHAECLRALVAAGEAPVADAAGDAGRQLESIFGSHGWALTFDPDGDIASVKFVGEKLHGLGLFNAVAPFVAPGSFIDFWQEYAGGESGRPNTRWVFNGETMTWQDLMPPEQREALRRAEAQSRNRDREAEEATNRENLLRLERGEPPFCPSCAAERRPPTLMTPKDWPAPKENPLVIMKAHVCPVCRVTFLPLSEQERFHAAVRAKHEQRSGRNA